jgi:hypothetical protein
MFTARPSTTVFATCRRLDRATEIGEFCEDWLSPSLSAPSVGAAQVRVAGKKGNPLVEDESTGWAGWNAPTVVIRTGMIRTGSAGCGLATDVVGNRTLTDFGPRVFERQINCFHQPSFEDKVSRTELRWHA